MRPFRFMLGTVRGRLRQPTSRQQPPSSVRRVNELPLGSVRRVNELPLSCLMLFVIWTTKAHASEIAGLTQTPLLTKLLVTRLTR